MIKVVAIAVAVVVLAVGGFAAGSNYKQGQWDAAKVAEAEGQTKALEAAAKEIAKIEVTQQTIVQKVRRETIEKPVYRDCVVPAAGIGLLNEAIDGKAQSASAD
jgi:hypothetical protein